MNVRGRVVLMGTALAASVSLAGCAQLGGVGASSGGAAAGAPAGTATGQATAGPTPNGGWPWKGTPPIEPRGQDTARGVRTMVDNQLGEILVDNRGRAIYRYEGDSANPPISRCAGACAQTWSPVQWTPNLSIIGVERTLLGRMRRTDGTFQLTVRGWPLYHYVRDTSPGDTNGQTVNGTWYVSRPNGTRAQMRTGTDPDTQFGDTGSTTAGSTGSGGVPGP
jgi:predicted lipoprotein with Yx(FWY)xxD motif